MLDKTRLSTALRHADLDLALGLGRECLDQNRTVWHIVREQDQPRYGLVVVELGDKAVQYLLDRHTTVGSRKVRAVAPVLTRAEKEHFHAVLPAFLRCGKDIRFLDAFRIDRLVGGDVRQSP